MTFRLEDLLQSSNPIEQALEDLELIDHGSVAYVFAHPDDDTLAIRLTEDGDEWFVYVMHLEDMDEHRDLVAAHAPDVREMLFHNGYYAAVMERLQPLSEDGWAEVARHLVRGIPPNDEHASFLEVNPKFLRFLEECPVTITDTRDENWMMRNGQIVVNDPSGKMMNSTMKSIFIERYGYAVPAARL